MRSPWAEPIETGDLGDWLEFARTQRVIPLLYALATTGGQEVPATIRTAHLEVMAAAVRLEHHLLDVTAILAQADIDCAVLKGAATAHLDYENPSLRQFGDVDLLVRPANSPEHARYWRSRAGVGRTHCPATTSDSHHAITFRRPPGVEVDLHQHIGHRSLGQLIPTDELLADSVPYDIAGYTLHALARPDRLIHAAVHSVASHAEYHRLSSIADVLLLAEAMAHDAESILDRADRWRVRPLLTQAIAEAYDTAQQQLPMPWLAALAERPARRDRFVERAYLGPHRHPVWEELAYLRLMNGWSDRIRYLSGYLATGEDYARRRHRSGIVAQIRYLWSRIRAGKLPHGPSGRPPARPKR